MTTFKDAQDKLGSRKTRKLANNTYLETQPDGSIAVRLHSTNIVTYHKNGAVTFHTGGWATLTTKARINTFSPVRISQVRGVWYASADNFQSEVIFADGMVYKNGKFSNTGGDPKKQIQIRKQVRAFADKYIKALAAGQVPAPSNGDCWGCLFQSDDDGQHPLGGKDHMLEHIKENYFVPSMIQSAFAKYGAAPIQQWGLASIWGKYPDGESFRQYATDARSKRMLTRFIYHEMGLPV